MKFRIGDRVRYIGTAEQDVYHGALSGVRGRIKQLEPFVLLQAETCIAVKGYEGDGLYDAGPSDGRYLEHVTESGQ